MIIKKNLKKSIFAALICVLAAALASCQNGTGQNTAQPENTANTVPVQNTETEEERQKREEEERRQAIEANTNENSIVLTETKPADQQYLDETLFLGDSNTVRFAYMADENG
ncbi:MAG: hypothetical protein IJM39_07390, partial [Firmicutes bacterium]|nr:hypothetical protein [Bacillota bacterium]